MELKKNPQMKKSNGNEIGRNQNCCSWFGLYVSDKFTTQRLKHKQGCLVEKSSFENFTKKIENVLKRFKKPLKHFFLVGSSK